MEDKKAVVREKSCLQLYVQIMSRDSHSIDGYGGHHVLTPLASSILSGPIMRRAALARTTTRISVQYNISVL